MKYILKKETKPTLTTFGKYKAVARHHQTVGVEDIIREVSQQCSLSEGAVISVMSGLSEVIGRRLRQGDKAWRKFVPHPCMDGCHVVVTVPAGADSYTISLTDARDEEMSVVWEITLPIENRPA